VSFILRTWEAIAGMDDYYFPPQKGLCTDADVLDAIRNLVAECGSQKVAAQHLGFNPKFLSDVLNGKRPISRRLAYQVGFVPAWNYLGGSHKRKV
jgi:hypothetical protein